MHYREALTKRSRSLDANELNIVIDDEIRTIPVSRQMIEDAEPVCLNMDRDMDRGWQLGKHFIPSPSRLQRCRIVANRMLTGLLNDNQASATLMAIYIVSRLPGVRTVDLNTEGKAEETQFYDEDHCVMI